MLLDLLIHLVALLLDSIDLSLRSVLFRGKSILKLFKALHLEEQFSFTLSDFKGVHGVLFIQLDQGLLKL